MSDSQEYINAYLENSIGTIHDYLNQNLQLRTQLKLVTKNLASKDEQVEKLSKELDGVKSQIDAIKSEHNKDDESVRIAKETAKRLQDENDSIKHKLSEFDALVKQFNDIKNEYKSKDAEVQNLTSQLNSSRDMINQKNEKISSLSTEIDSINKVLNDKDIELENLRKSLSKSSSSPKKVINTKTSNVKEKDEEDDF